MDSFRRRTLLRRSIDRQKEMQWAIDSFQVASIEELLKQAAVTVCKTFKCPMCVVSLIEEDYLKVESTVGIDLEQIKINKIPIGKSFSGRLLKRGEPRLFIDVSPYIETIPENMEHYFSGSMVVTPLMFNKKILGLISICRPAPLIPFSIEDFERLITYGNQTAFAITSQRLADKRNSQLLKVQAELSRLNEQLRKDISCRMQVEEALHKAEREKAAILDAMSELVIYVDTDMKIIWSNRTMNRQFNMKSGQAEGRYCYEVLHKLSRPCRICPVVKTIETGRPYTIDDFSSLGKRWTLRAYPVWNEEGNLVGVVEIVTDITDHKREEEERKVLEERLQRSEKMEALGTLAGGVAHDLNNVLGIVVGYSELLLDKIDESSTARSYAINIMQGGVKAAAIVQDLLTLARRGVNVKKVFNLNPTIKEFQESPEFMKLRSFHPAVQIKNHLEPDLLNITGSPVHLGKTFFNLVSNAAEAMPNGGVVTITTSNTYLEKPIQGYDDVREGDYVVLSVSDTGEGIPAPDLKRIFEPFYTKKVMGRSGTGLGLAVVWGTVKDHNGYINIQSEEGKGTTFTLYFPVTREEVSEDQISIPLPEYMGNGESILVVDDVEGQRELATHMLNRLNYTATTASSGEKAIEYLKTNNADIIVLDMIMAPGIDGLDTYRGILEINPKQKAIIVSGFSESDRVRKAQEMGAGSFVRKPYIMEKIGLAVKNELTRK